jgi:hypothetical protein
MGRQNRETVVTLKHRYTQNQVPRGTRPDAADFSRFYLIKNVSKLAATYQIRLLAYRASEAGKNLIIRVPKSCEVQPSLNRLIRDMGRTVVVEKI